ncbi:BlaI/MecI/CopY family transcriptional regulator [Brevundimonas sp.]|uniref:BlaI/MecI/CopY family transcriptional regulator n=1 Tax=Brevundimonas sp. TaxID=1871086 RepID=UPI0027379D68|nr:BlaI/MecI/CopY family transcriptional regulator [Brevundimonas sp.]MDP3801292.1 BlaI/MecI/CopY family transcriptional regulator [Brevundimonas sp.]
MRLHVTEAESAVLAAIWARGPLSFASLIEEVKAGQPWADATIKTLLHRLMQKGAVKSVKEDGRQRYHAVIDRQTWVEGEVQDLLDRLFDGKPDRLVALLADRLDL